VGWWWLRVKSKDRIGPWVVKNSRGFSWLFLKRILGRLAASNAV
jgi:hypothetical protein